MSEPDDSPVEYIIHPAMRPWLDEFLDHAGFIVVAAPESLQGDLPTFFIFPKTERVQRAEDAELLVTGERDESGGE